MANAATKMPPMIFFNIGWMRRYSGEDASDPTLGRHGHLRTHLHGAEAFNFKSSKGRVYGYRPPGEKGVSLRRLGARSSDASIDGVLVIWLALRPGSSETVVVGWYRDATVHRSSQTLPADILPMKRHYREYLVSAAAENARLLPVEARNFVVRSVRRVPGGFGQSPTYYDVQDLYRTRIWAYLRSVERNIAARRSRGTRSPRNTDTELRKRVEETAVAHAKRYYTSAEGGGYDVKSVEAAAKGWDLECSRPDDLLRVEVKGCSGSEIRAELTPNEYEKMRDTRFRPSYVIYVVTDCLGQVPAAAIFRHDGGTCWETQDGRKLRLTPMEAARISCDRAASRGNS
ncbi:MAG: hypothetical protein QOH86_1931 [Sphingomonadales bacterium]|jgi:hypothetical protein|nr:hypothetical protein [Sphingomonadales bacterium]